MAKRFRWLSMVLMVTLFVQSVFISFVMPEVANAAPPPHAAAPPKRNEWVEDVHRRTSNSKHYRAGDYQVVEIEATPSSSRHSGNQAPGKTGQLAQQGQDLTAENPLYNVRFANRGNSHLVEMTLPNGRQISLGLAQTPEVAAGPGRSDPPGPGGGLWSGGEPDRRLHTPTRPTISPLSTRLPPKASKRTSFYISSPVSPCSRCPLTLKVSWSETTVTAGTHS